LSFYASPVALRFLGQAHVGHENLYLFFAAHIGMKIVMRSKSFNMFSFV
jgi:hypothetical protein